MSRIVLQSPAKLNLFLKVINKRSDGFHNIKTLFQRINLVDDITFKSLSKDLIRIKCDHPHVPTGPKNLVYKVANYIKKEYDIKEGVDINIKKRIPVAAGLAGGSSNAATAIVGLNRLWSLRLSQKKMLEIARKIGSDVAFFIHDKSWALGTQKGDKIQELKLRTKLWQIIVVPRIKMYSWKVYGGLKLSLTKQRDNANILIHNLRNNNIKAIGQGMANDLESEIIRLCPKLLKLKEKLNSLNAKGVMISGSGPSVFGLTENEQEAQYMKSILSKRFTQVFVVRTL